MNPKKAIIVDALSPLLKLHGYRRRLTTWWRSNDDCVSVIGLEKGTYGEQYHLDMGITVRSISNVSHPSIFRCHIVLPFDMLLEEPLDFRKYLDFELYDIPEKERKRQITEFISSTGLPFLDSISTIEGIKSAYHKGLLKRFAFVLKAKVALGLEDNQHPSAGLTSRSS